MTSPALTRVCAIARPLLLSFLLGAFLPLIAADTSTSSSVQRYADPLSPNAVRAPGSPVKGAALPEGATTWLAAKGVTLDARGITTQTPNGAHHAITPVAGLIHVQADIDATGSGFTGIALGRGDLSGNFWNTVSMIYYISGDGGFNLMVGSKNLISKGDKSLLKPRAPNQLDLLVNTVARTVTAKVNGTVVLDNVLLPETAKLAGITSVGFRFNEPLTAGAPAVSNYRAEITSLATAGLEPADVSMCIVRPDQETTLTWRVGSPGPSDRIPYVIRDYFGNQVGSGSAILSAGKLATITRAWPAGYHEIAFTEAAQTFGITSVAEVKGPRDLFFGMDAALSWLEMDFPRREGLVKSLGLMGIGISRDRLGMGNVNSVRGKYNWEGNMKFESLRKTYEANGIRILENLDGGGAHLGKPKDLAQMAVSISEMGKHWPIWAATEVHNEPDIHPEPADRYVPLAKVMSYALAQARPDVPVVTGALATMPPSPFFDTLVANGALEDSNAISFHSYDRAPDVEAMVGRYRTWLQKAGKEALPLWHTECGLAWKSGPDRPPYIEDAQSALEVTAKAIESRVCGVTAYFPFVLVYYIEGTKNFALTGREGTPLRNLSAYATAISVLSNKHYLGDLRGLDASVKLARVFEGSSAGEVVAVLYTGKVDAKQTLTLPFAAKRAAGADGRALTLSGNTVPAPDGLTYVWFNRADLAAGLKTDSTAMRLYQLGQKPLVQKRRASPLILHFLSETIPSRPSSRRYLITHETAADLPVNVRAYNLSQADIYFTPELTVHGRPPVKRERIKVPAMGSADISWKFDASSILDIAETRMITVTGQAEGVIQPLPLAIPLVMSGDLDQHLKRHSLQTPLPIEDLKSWKQNIGNGTATFSVGPEGGWKMDAKFTNTSTSWTYPKFVLPSQIDPSRYTGIVVRARLAQSAKTIAVIAGSAEGKPSFWVPDLFPADGGWHVVYVPFGEFKPGPGGHGNQNTRLAPQEWTNLGFGFGNSAANVMEISHVLLVGGSGE